MTNWVNFTGKDIMIYRGDTLIHEIPRGTNRISVRSDRTFQQVSIDGQEVQIVEIGPDEKAYPPEREEGTLFIVPASVARQRPERDDLRFPYRIFHQDRDVIECEGLAFLKPRPR